MIKYVFYKKKEERKKKSNIMIHLLTLESFILVLESARIDIFFGVMMHFYWNINACHNYIRIKV